MKVDFYITQSNNYNTTGGEIFETDTIPEVKTFPLVVYQNAQLKRKE